MGALGSLPARLGRYELQETIASGTMGLVCRAWDPLLGRRVALKVPRLDFPMRADERELMEQRFLREASLAAALSHPHIVVVHDVGRDPETHTPYIALEYLEGCTLDQLASPQRLEWREALRLTASLAMALHHAHLHGVIHRDIKPSNVMVLPNGEPKILDFGIARPAAGQLTLAGESWGTPSYMSPEQAMANPVDGRSDLFSLGSVLYELLTGRRAFGSDGVASVMARVAREEPSAPSSLNPALSPLLDAIVARALAKDPAARYPDGQAFAQDLISALEGLPAPAQARTPTRPLASADAENDPDGCAPTLQIPNCPVPLQTRHSPLRAWGRVVALAAVLIVALMRLPADSGQVPAGGAAKPSSGTRGVFENWRLVERADFAATPLAARARVLAPDGLSLAALVPQRPAHVALAVEHGFKRAQLKVWVDDRLALDAPLVGTQARRLLVLRRSRGSLREVLDVPAGERRLRVSVASGGARASAESRATFASGETRVLQVKLGSRVELEWKR